MMTADDVIEVLHCLDRVGVAVWLDGGWGVDALLGYPTRPHDDLDAVIHREDVSRVNVALAALGYHHVPEAQPGLPTRLVLRDRVGRQVDFHPVVFDADGDGWQELGDGTWGCYPADGLGGTGTIAGRPVSCITPELQLRHHLGYEPEASDRYDLRQLAERFHLSLPAPYWESSDAS
jgi:lincosamide nucleotidyltransferase A/C/D/E